MKFLLLVALGLAGCAAINDFDAKPVSVDPISGHRSCVTIGNTFVVSGQDTGGGARYTLSPTPAPTPGTPVIVEIDGTPVASGIERVKVTDELRAAMDAGRRIDVTRTQGWPQTNGQPLDGFVWCLG